MFYLLKKEFCCSTLLKDSYMFSCMVFHRAHNAIHILPRSCNNHRRRLTEEECKVSTMPKWLGFSFNSKMHYQTDLEVNNHRCVKNTHGRWLASSIVRRLQPLYRPRRKQLQLSRNTHSLHQRCRHKYPSRMLGKNFLAPPFPKENTFIHVYKIL